MAEKISKAKKTRVAVVDFTDLQGDVTVLGRFIAEEFSVALASAGKDFQVIDRTHLKSIIKEHKLSAAGIIDPQTARELGKIAGVDALVTGTLTPFGDSIRIAVKILDTSTAEVIDAYRINIAKTQAISELLGAVVAQNGSISTPKPNLGKSIKMQEVEGFVFDLVNCKKDNTKATCDLIITNKKTDRTLIIYGGTRLFDDSGNEYGPNYIQISNSKEKITFDSSHIKKSLISNVPTHAVLTFDGLDTNANAIAVLNIVCQNFKVQFRNIPFSK